MSPNNRLASALRRAYSLAHTDRFLECSTFRKIFVPAYFLYKKTIEDSLGNLVRRKPELFQKGDILDIGANIGYTSCVLASAVRAGSKVYAFEPDQLSYQILKEVIHRKNLSGIIEAMNLAVGRSEGYLQFWHNQKHSADHRVVTEQFSGAGLDQANIATVAVTSIDSFVRSRDLRNISFMKVDAQGYEWAVCEGMKDTLTGSPDLCIYLEYCPEALLQLGSEPARVLDFLWARGYQLHVLTHKGPELTVDEAPLRRFLSETGYVDLLCSKRVID